MLNFISTLTSYTLSEICFHLKMFAVFSYHKKILNKNIFSDLIKMHFNLTLLKHSTQVFILVIHLFKMCKTVKQEQKRPYGDALKGCTRTSNICSDGSFKLHLGLQRYLLISAQQLLCVCWQSNFKYKERGTR
jgi:hypothetical protein